MTFYQEGSGKQRVFDAGCGTGLVGQCFTDLVSQGLVELYGGDWSSGMLEVAKCKNIKFYNDLEIVNLKKPLPYDAESFDGITCSGAGTLWSGNPATSYTHPQERWHYYCDDSPGILSQHKAGLGKRDRGVQL